MATTLNDYIRAATYEPMMPADGTANWVINANTISSGITSTIYSGGQPNQAIQVPIPPAGVMSIDGKRRREGVEPQVYFRYVKRKFKLIERAKLNKRLRVLEIQRKERALEA